MIMKNCHNGCGNYSSLLAASIIYSSIISVAAADVLQVPSKSYPTIEDALTVAKSGDTVEVSPGEYMLQSYDGITVPSGVTLEGKGDAAEDTIISKDDLLKYCLVGEEKEKHHQKQLFNQLNSLLSMMNENEMYQIETKEKIIDLKEIEAIYQDIKTNDDAKKLYSYVLQLFEEKAIKLEVEELKVKKIQVAESREAKALEIKRIDDEIEALDERSKELYRLLSSDTDFVQNEYLDKQIIKTRAAIEELTLLEKDYLTRASYVKDSVKNMRRLFDSDGLKRLANVSLNNVHKDLLDQTKLTLIDIDNILSGEYDKLVASKNGFEREKQELLKEINEISQTLRGLENRTLRYNPMVMALKQELENGLKQMFGYDVSVYILAELLEITDEKWADTIEVYLNRRRFNLIIEPRYYDAALQIYNRVKSHRNIHGVGLVNTKKIATYNSSQPRSLASIITSDNVDAKRYINYVLGNVIMYPPSSKTL